MIQKKRTSLTPATHFRAADDDGSGEKRLEGYFIRFNEETKLFDGYFETVSPTAIADDIQKQDIRALFDHDSAKVLGRTSANTLTLTKDDQGLFGSILINEDDPEALSVYAKVMRGDISSASFAFCINNDDMTRAEDGVHDTLTDVQLFEVSIVTWPAYPTTEIGARSQDVAAFEKREFELKKKAKVKELQDKWKIQSF
jgi:HK97 family phage prohead protease